AAPLVTFILRATDEEMNALGASRLSGSFWYWHSLSRCCSLCSLGEAVVPGAIIPEDRALRAIGQWELEEARDRAGVLAVRVREVGREDDVPDANEVVHRLHRILVALDGDEALPLEVLARLHREIAREDVAEPLVVLVHPPQKERRPACVPLEERDAEPRMPLEDAAAAEAHGREHLLTRVTDRVAQHDI